MSELKPVKGFIEFGSFLVKKSEILYAKKVAPCAIVLAIGRESKEQTFQMTYAFESTRDDQFTLLALEIEAWRPSYSKWEHPIVDEIHRIRMFNRECRNEIGLMKKELIALRKELRKNRITKT